MFAYLKKEKVMTISLILAVISMFFVHPDSGYSKYIDWRVLGLLFCLMVIVKGFQKIGLFDIIINSLFGRFKTSRSIVLMLVLMCFFGSMIITNDVALITFVPFAIFALRSIKQEKYMIVTVVLQTLAANLGSMFTPIGNPQNLYLFSVSGMSTGEFFGTMWMPTLVSLVALVLAVLIVIPGNKVTIVATDTIEASEKKEWICYSILFVVNLLVVFRVLDWIVALGITVAGIAAVGQKHLFRKVDYALLLTFIGFFVFIGNIGRVPAISEMIGQLLAGREVWISIFFSQFMSNVPAAILLSGFTTNYTALLLGTNIGGLGTLIASMASLISYKLYAEEADSNKGKYFITFTAWNVGFLLLIGIFLFIFIIK